jgi:hypothetical protein
VFSFVSVSVDLSLVLVSLPLLRLSVLLVFAGAHSASTGIATQDLTAFYLLPSSSYVFPAALAVFMHAPLMLPHHAPVTTFGTFVFQVLASVPCTCVVQAHVLLSFAYGPVDVLSMMLCSFRPI